MSLISDINRALPEDVLMEIMNLRDRESTLAWDYGRMANKVYHFVVANDLQYTRLEVAGFIAWMVDNNRSPNTILRYATVEDFFANKKARAKYEVLPFSHFEFAMQFGQDWRTVLERSMAMMAGSFGRPPSRAMLEREFKGETVRRMEAQAGESPIVRPPAQSADDGLEDILQDLTATLQSRLHLIQVKRPRIAPLIAQALLLIRQAQEMMNVWVQEEVEV